MLFVCIFFLTSFLFAAEVNHRVVLDTSFHLWVPTDIPSEKLPMRESDQLRLFAALQASKNNWRIEFDLNQTLTDFQNIATAAVDAPLGPGRVARPASARLMFALF